MVSLSKIQLVEINKQKAFTLIEILVVVAIIGTLSAVGVVAYNGYTKSAKAKTAELNYTNINKALMFEFMKCELDSSSTVFNNHKCSDSNSPSINTISGFITSNLKMSNPYGSNLINKSPCSQGSVSISSPSKGNYSVSFYSAPQKKIIITNMGTTWTPVKVGSNTKYTNVNTGCNTTWTSVNTGANTTYSSVNTGSNTKYSSP
jgi:prepilin-type N-terminal cleavage/methylation domain-containing protein